MFMFDVDFEPKTKMNRLVLRNRSSLTKKWIHDCREHKVDPYGRFRIKKIHWTSTGHNYLELLGLDVLFDPKDFILFIDDTQTQIQFFCKLLMKGQSCK